jgi:tRNA-modifying protein YgfZ
VRTPAGSAGSPCDVADVSPLDPDILGKMEPKDLEAQALRESRAYSDLSDWRKTLVRGSDAGTWLNDLLTADLANLPIGTSRPALLLSPTGRIRATVTVGSIHDGLILVQDPEQPSAVGALLAPYILSSDVELTDASGSMSLLAFPGREPPGIPGTDSYRPSCLGPGADLVVKEGRDVAASETLAGLVRAGPESREVWRIERGIPRFPVDLTPESLPHEADLDAAIDYGKGCYLGQEAVAKVRNLGHPTWVVLAMHADGHIDPNEAVVGEGEEVGRVTSAASGDGRTAVIARVRWSARELPLASSSGATLRISGLASIAA